MEALVTIVTVAMFGVPIVGAALVAIAAARGEVNLRGLLTDTAGAFSPGRLQLLIATLLVCLYYLGTVVASPNATAMPALPAWFVAAMLGSHGIYLGGKSTGLPSVAQLLEPFLGR
ncbi:MAG: hypothetical protein WAL80_19560 [Xanthobacteraceae bacterium]|jgi:hypothetical protein